MNREDKLELLEEWQHAYQTLLHCHDQLCDILMTAPEAPLLDAGCAILGLYTKATSKLIGDTAEWLDWYALENDFGKKARTVLIMGEELPRAVISLSILLDVIEG